MEKILKCEDCEREAHDLSFEGRTCDKRMLNGSHCGGKLRLVVVEEVPDPHLECDSCQRRADKMSMEGKACNFLLPNHHHCTGTLRLVG